MPIQTPRIIALNLWSIKRAVEMLSRNSLNLQSPTTGGKMYLSSLPSVAEWKDGDAMFADDGGTMKLVFKMNNLRHTINLTQE